MKMFLGQNHKFLCHSSWDFIGINTNFAVPNSVKTFLLTATTAQRMNCWTAYFNRNNRKLFWKENEPSNRFILQTSNDAENKQHDHTLTAIASSWDTISRYDRRYSMKITNKTSHVVKNFNNDDLDLLQSPSVSPIPPTKSRTIKTLQLSKLFLEITLSNTILKKDLYPQ